MIDGTQVLSLDALSSKGQQKLTPVLYSKVRQSMRELDRAGVKRVTGEPHAKY